MVKETLQEHPEKCVELIYPFSLAPALLHAPERVSHHQLDEKLFKALDIFGTKAPILVCAVPTIAQWRKEEAPRGLELICPLGDPSNVGALLRTCQALGVQKVILLKEAASPFHPKSTRAASGAMLNIEYAYGPSITDVLEHTIDSTIVALHASGRNDVATFQWKKNVRILVGEEAQGLPDVTFPNTISIRMAKGMNSLNAVVAASIAMYAYRQQHPL